MPALPAYAAETWLQDALQEILAAEDWQSVAKAKRHAHQRPRRGDWTLTIPTSLPGVGVRALDVESLPHRRVFPPDDPTRAVPVPLSARVVALLEEYAYVARGFESTGILGPHLNSYRLHLWARWAAAYEQRGRDPEASVGPDDHDALARLLIRRGVEASSLDPGRTLPSQLVEISRERKYLVAPVAYHCFAGPLSDLPGPEAVEEVLSWARANWHLKQHEELVDTRLVRTIWNRQVDPARPTVSVIETIREIFPLDDRGDYRLRQACLRLLCRIEPQRQAWGRVEIPTSWFRKKKNPDDPKSIVGVSGSNYVQLLEALEQSGVLVLVEKGSHAARDRKASTYEVDGVSFEGQEFTLAEAENILRE